MNVNRLTLSAVMFVSACIIPTLAGAFCVQDQYGNQYNLTVDASHGYLYGTVSNAQGCATDWPVTGSYVPTTEGLAFELTAANPLGNMDTCQPIYKLKGRYPAFSWFYIGGFGEQTTSFVDCGTEAIADPRVGGARK